MKLNFKRAGFYYWTVGCVLVGVLLAPLFYSAKPQDFSKYKNQMKHGTIEVPHSLPVPEVHLDVYHDIHSGWNLHITTKNFTFTPQLVNTPDRPNEGHAHLYINGYKITRIYGNWYHVGALSPGDYDFKVSLNGNDHRTYTYNGKEIASTVHVHQPYEKPMSMNMMMKGRGTIGWPGLPDAKMNKNSIMGGSADDMSNMDMSGGMSHDMNHDGGMNHTGAMSAPAASGHAQGASDAAGSPSESSTSGQ